MELDIATSMRLTRQKVIVECKSYSSNVPAEKLNAFLGKLMLLKLNEPDLHAIFVALPGLTADGDDQANLLAKSDPRFQSLNAEGIVQRLISEGVISREPPTESLCSDFAVIITDEGTYSAVKLLDESSRLPTGVMVWARAGTVPDPVVRLLTSDSYASGLQVLRSIDNSQGKKSTLSVRETFTPEVVGSQSDFEYQFPASPAFFVGRDDLLHDFTTNILGIRNTGRLFVLNGQSGWGKSSLSLKLKTVVEAALGASLVLDTRAATSRDYLPQAIRTATLHWMQEGIFSMPDTASFASLASAVATLKSGNWSEKPAMLVFDQFENVLRDSEVALAFRDFALHVPELPGNILIGFSWKTDVVGLVESYPFELREDIRKYSYTLSLQPMGPSDLGKLLQRVELSLGQSLSKELKERLREYCQGLPWLFKKLASHVISEIRSGTPQDQLAAQGLNAGRLFANDIAELDPQVLEALKAIARRAPILSSEATEIASPEILGLLMERRLLVRVAESLDLYWDIFKDYLLTGEVPVKESYILRQTPASISRLLQVMLRVGKEITAKELATELHTSVAVVFNLARELRLLGVLKSEAGSFKFDVDLFSQLSEGTEEGFRTRIAHALSNHRAYQLLQRLFDEETGDCSVEDFAESLPEIFPAVPAKQKTWLTYAKAFAKWFTYAGLVKIKGDRICLAGAPAAGRLLRTIKARRSGGYFPQGAPGPTLALLPWLEGKCEQPKLNVSAKQKAVLDLETLGILARGLDGEIYVQKELTIAGDGNSIDKPRLWRD